MLSFLKAIFVTVLIWQSTTVDRISKLFCVRNFGKFFNARNYPSLCLLQWPVVASVISALYIVSYLIRLSVTCLWILHYRKSVPCTNLAVSIEWYKITSQFMHVETLQIMCPNANALVVTPAWQLPWIILWSKTKFDGFILMMIRYQMQILELIDLKSSVHD